ncbi:carboxypeptidase regulatory-like domain-containing protein [Allochromatium vinosum]|nr:carboxypeptidase regulatory-like domain-containing protein [Allochromatium vinosum]
MQQAVLMAMGLTLTAGIQALAGAQTQYEVPTRLIPAGDAVMQMAETSKEWAIRPAEEVNPLMQSTDTTISPNVPPLDTRSSEIKNDGGIRYVSGGVGESERRELDALASEFNLHLMFATQGSGEYLSAVQVKILDTHDTPLLTVLSKGPWFYAQLPRGRYTVEVIPTGHRGEGQTQRKAVNIDGSGRSRLDFYWTK